ncbi:hypothetical protein JM16_001534 [Phytophthora kernoviae]|uniref:Sulfhydryl oxidase n=1 Tax=Phytophthora kernoviae TaxID=325452 RepID=A0A8T0M2P9_9STRA|nr:hypothetical protein JM16_001534 [Phytophthora kernoviae]
MYHAPPDAEEGITMPHVGHIYARDVAKWIEEQLTENGIKSGVDIEQMYPLPKRRSDTKEEFKFAEPVEPTHDDQADDIKLNRLRDAGTTVLFAFDDGFFMGTTVLEGERMTASDIKTVSPREPWKPSDIMSAIRLFVKYFFGCEECRQHFLKVNHDSMLKKLAAKDKEGSHAVVFWIWKMHNTVNKRLKHVMWPTQKSCPSCYVDNGEPMSLSAAQLNEEEIVAYISSAYKFEELERGGVLSALWSSMGASAFSLMRHDTSPLFTKSFQVHSLSTANYDVVLRDKNVVWLIDYYAPWCPHCRHFAPDWDKVANFYAATDRVKVGAVDCTKNQEICNQENINGFPGVKIHHVPADSEASIMMPRGIKNTRVVIGWAEKLMEEHGMKSGVSAEDLAAQLKLLRNDRVAKDGAKGETVKYNDQALEVNITVNDIPTTPLTESWKSSNIMAAIRLYVKNFFGCEECREHFMQSNPASKIDDLAIYDAEGPDAVAIQPRDNSPLFTAEQCQVRTLNSDGHAKMLADTNAVWLVDYYAPWCPHCRQFAPAWEKAASFYADSANTHVAAVDCTQNSEVCNNEGILGYPTIKLYHVPPEGKESIKMPPKSRKNTNTVIAWVEEQMQEHGMKASAGADDIDAHIEKINTDCEMGTATTKTAAAVEPDGPSYNDQDMTMKYKRLHDAGIAAVSTFENGFYVGTTVLEGERYDAAVTWVEALAASFPMEGNRVALASLAAAMKKQNRWGQAEWDVLITEWKANATVTSFPVNLFEWSEKKKWAYCTTYTCGVWTLFHTLSLSEVQTASPLKPSEIMAAIRLFVKYFFSCEECQRHFMMANPGSLIGKLAESDAEGPKAVAIWIWKMHNKVNKVLKYSQWPSTESCPKCYVINGEPVSLDPARLHEDEILAYIMSVFGHKDTDLFFLDAAHNGILEAAKSFMQRFSALTIAVVALIFILPFMMRSKKMPKTQKTD